MKDVVIKASGSIELKSWKEEYASELFQLVDSNREYLAEFLNWVPNVKQESDQLKFITDSIESLDKETGMELGIWFEGKLVGCIGLHEIDRRNNKTSIGYYLGRDFQGKGIMTKSVKALIDFCFKELQMNRIEIRAAVQNTKSRAIPERLGFTKEGILREAELVQGKYLDNVVYGLLRGTAYPTED